MPVTARKKPRTPESNAVYVHDSSVNVRMDRLKMQDQMSGVENAEPENAGPESGGSTSGR